MRPVKGLILTGAVRALLFSILLGSTVAALSGQTFEQRVNDIVARTRFKIGPFRIHPVLEFSQFGWTSNILGRTESEKQVSDFVITPSPKLNVYFLWGYRLILSFTENPEYHFYLREHRFNHFTNNLRAELSFPFLGSLVVTAGLFSQNQRLLSQMELDRQVESRSEGGRAEVAYETGRRLSFTLSGLVSRLTYKDFLGPEGSTDLLSLSMDREERSGQFEIRYQVFTASVFFIQAGYGQYIFQEEQARWKDSESVRFLSGFRLPQDGLISGSLALGFKRFFARESGAGGYSGLIADAQVSFRLSPGSAVSAGYNRDNAFSYYSDVLYYLSDSFNVSATVNVSRFLALRAGGTYHVLRYPDAEQEPGSETGEPPPRGRDRFSSLLAGFIVPIGKSLRVGLSYHYWTRPRGLPESRDGHLVTLDLIRQ